MSKKTAQEMMKVIPDIGQVCGILRAKDVQGPMRDYCEARNSGLPVEPSVARAAYNEAKSLVDAAKANGQNEALRGVSVGILEGLLTDIQSYAKVAANRESINKLANKFAALIAKQS